jgi:hypothetical protein
MLKFARVYDCMFVEQKDDKVYYILRYNKSISRECEGYKMKVPPKLRKLETEILELKGRRREKAMKTYRRILFSLEDEPIYFVRY